MQIIGHSSFAHRNAMPVQAFGETGNRKKFGEDVQAIRHHGFQDCLGLDLVAFDNIAVKQNPIITLQEFALFRFCLPPDNFREPAFAQIIVECLYNPATGRGVEGIFVEDHSLEAEKFREREGEHQAGKITAAQLRGNLLGQ